MGAPQAHGIPSPLLLAAELKRSNLKKVHTTFRPTACFVNQPPSCLGPERASRGLFVSGVLEASSEQTRDKTSVNSKSVESPLGLGHN